MCESREVSAACGDYINFATDEVGSQSWEPIINPFGPPVFDRHVLPFNVAGLA
jgi:hypothetical protein